MKKKSNTYLADNPISTHSEDAFDRSSFAERVANTIAHRDDVGGLVIGIYGEWGDGKTSTLNLMQEMIQKHHKNIVLTKFNPWYFQSTPELIKGFFDQLAEAIGKAMPTATEQALGAVKDYGKVLSVVASNVSIFGAKFDLNAAQETLSNMKKDPPLQKLKTRIEGLLKKSDKRIVIFIDDIDRLDKDEIHEIFKLVRLSGSFEKVTYVLAFDEKMVASALGERYSSAQGNAGLKFIEKIVQVPLHLPPAQKEVLLNALYQEIDKTLLLNKIDLNESDSSSVGYSFQTAFGFALRTPRQVKRYANAIMFAVPVLKNEVSMADLLLIEAIRTFYPNMYETIRDNQDFFLTEGTTMRKGLDKDKASILEALYKDAKREGHKDALEHLIGELFPRASNHGSYGDSWEKPWAEEKKICSRIYFRRYFNYGIPKGDIADSTFNAFVLDIQKAKDQKEIVEYTKKFLKKHTTRAFIEKLPFIEDSLKDGIDQKLAVGVALNASSFPNNGDFFSEFSRAIAFIARVNSRISEIPYRDIFASKMLELIPSLPFAVQAFSLMSHDDRKPEAEQPMSKEAKATAGTALTARIAKDASHKPPYKHEHGASQLMWHWKAYDKAQLVTYLKKRFQNHPNETVDFLLSFVGTSYGSEGKRKADLSGDSFPLITDFIDEKTLISFLKKSKYWKHLDRKEVHFNRKISPEQLIVNQFVNMFDGFKSSKKES